MANKLSPRLASIIETIPFREGMQVMEIGCGPGAAARAVVQKLGDGHLLAIDRSKKAISQISELCKTEIGSGQMSVRQTAIEDFVLQKKEKKFDIIFAIRVGALDARHPELQQAAIAAIKKVLAIKGRLFVDGKEIKL